jgi:hypothetical protein
MLEILFIGLVMFANRAGGGRTVVLPSLSEGVTVTTPCTPAHVEGHMAYISAAADDVKSCDACETIPGDRKRLQLDGDELTISGIPSSTYAEHETFATIIPSLQATCETFTLAIPDTATTLDITSGTLRAQKIKMERTSILKVGTDGDITFTAKRNGVERKMVLYAGTLNVTIGNQGLSAIGGKRALAENHFLAFYALAEDEVSCKLPLEEGQIQTTIACSNSRYP